MDAALRGAAARVAQRRHSSFADTVETVLEELEHVFSPATVFLGMLEDGQGPLRVMDARGEPTPGIQRGNDLSLGGEGAVPAPEPLQDLGVRSFVGVPLETSEGHQVGCLCAAGSESGLFDEDQVDLLTVLARLLAREIEVVRTRAELRRLTELVRDPRGTHPLTGLPDRAQMLEWLRRERALSRRGTHQSHLLICRLEGVRAVRAQFGEAMAELLVKDAAETLRGALREADHCGHVQDDIMAAILVGCETPENAGVVADRYRAALARVSDVRPVSLKLAFAAHSLNDPATPGELLATAESEAREAEADSLVPEPVEAPETVEASS
jgi:GGDEF domain-containing protein